MRRTFLLLLRFGLGLALLYWALRRAEWGATSQISLAHIQWGWMAAAVALGGVALLGWALRWYVFLRLYEVKTSFREVAKLTLYADFFNFYFLGPLGADGLRLLMLGKRHPGGKASIVGSIFLDHASGLLAVGIWYACLTRTHREWLSTSAGPLSGAIVTTTDWAIGLLCFITFMGVGWMMDSKVQNHMRHRFHLDRYMQRWGGLIIPPGRRWTLLLGQVISIAVIAAYYAAWWAAAQAVGNPLPAGRLLAVLPVVDFTSGLPITVSGVGVRENLFVELLGRQLGAGRAVEISLLGFAAVGLWGLIGGVALAFHHYKSRSALVIDPES